MGHGINRIKMGYEGQEWLQDVPYLNMATRPRAAEINGDKAIY